MSFKNNHTHLSILSVLTLALIISACSGSADKKETASAPAGEFSLMPLADAGQIEGWESDAEAGLGWQAPPSWEVGPDRPMRAATYFASDAEGGEIRAECRVNFFGKDQGGGVEGNIARWVSQMEVDGEEGVSPEPQTASLDQNGITLTILELHGTFLERMGPMTQSSARQTGFAMFAVIAEGPEGSVFFKMTGPEALMEAERENFQRMIGSIGPSTT